MAKQFKFKRAYLVGGTGFVVILIAIALFIVSSSSGGSRSAVGGATTKNASKHTQGLTTSTTQTPSPVASSTVVANSGGTSPSTTLGASPVTTSVGSGNSSAPTTTSAVQSVASAQSSVKCQSACLPTSTTAAPSLSCTSLAKCTGGVISSSEPADGSSAVFSHAVSASNVNSSTLNSGNYTVSPYQASEIDNSLSNNNPNAVLFLTFNWSYNSNDIYANHVIFPFYDSESAKWWIVDASGRLPLGSYIDVGITTPSNVTLVQANSTNRVSNDEVCSQSPAPNPQFSLVALEGNYGDGSTPVTPYPIFASNFDGRACALSSSTIPDGAIFALFDPGDPNFVNASSNPPSGWSSDYVDMTNVGQAHNVSYIPFATPYFQSASDISNVSTVGVFWDSTTSTWAGFNESHSAMVAPQYFVGATFLPGRFPSAG